MDVWWLMFLASRSYLWCVTSFYLVVPSSRLVFLSWFQILPSMLFPSLIRCFPLFYSFISRTHSSMSSYTSYVIQFPSRDSFFSGSLFSHIRSPTQWHALAAIPRSECIHLSNGWWYKHGKHKRHKSGVVQYQGHAELGIIIREHKTWTFQNENEPNSYLQSVLPLPPIDRLLDDRLTPWPISRCCTWKQTSSSSVVSRRHRWHTSPITNRPKLSSTLLSDTLNWSQRCHRLISARASPNLASIIKARREKEKGLTSGVQQWS